MMGASRRVAAFLVLLIGACGTGDQRVDPDDLELRDLLGVSPEVASAWDADQRAAAHRVLLAGLDDDVALAVHAPLRVADPAALDDAVAGALATLDGDRFADGLDALGLVRVTPSSDLWIVARTAAPRAPATLELALADRWRAEPVWGHLALRGHDVLAALARDAGHGTGPVVVAPAPRLAVIASYVATTPPRLLVNPVLLAALEPDPAEATAVLPAEPAVTARAASPPPRTDVPGTAAGGNPYSFYGSVAECAAAERTRCETCLAASNCVAETNTSDGNAECTQLGADGGRGYYLMCINLALAITAVDHCTTSAAPQCPADTQAATSLGTLEQNAGFLTDATCADALDTCLAKIYGPPGNPFPTLDAGVTPTEPPRSTNVSCGDACSSNNTNCSSSPSCDGPSCNNSLSCDSACSSSNDQHGCGGNCDSCSSSSSSGGGGSCSSGSSSGSSGGGCSGGSCGGSGGSCGSGCSSSSGSTSGGGCSGGSCGGSGGSCGGSGGSCGGSGSSCGGSKCSVAASEPGAQMALAVSVVWGFLPVPFAAVIRRRAKRKRAAARAEVSR